METPAPRKDTQTDVLIVGAGPTGLALATTLLRSGVTPVIVEKLSTGQNTSRAAVIHAHTLEVLERIGAAEPLANSGLKMEDFSVRDRDRVLLRMNFKALPSPYNYLLMIPQDMTEKILVDAVVQAKGTVRWGCSVESLSETGDGITATVSTDQGKQTIHARYVVGADGMHSIVRQTAGIGFTGSTYEESFVLADVDMTWGHGRDEVTLFFSAAGLVVVAPLPNGTVRIVATLENAPEQPSVADIQALLDTRGPTRGAAKIDRVHWGSRFRLHHRVADQYRKGRYLLVGDAAHVHSPAGGQGMNTGLVDACVLGEMLSNVVLGRQEDSHLDRYGPLRRPAAEEVLRIADRFTKLATMRGAPKRFLRNILLQAVGRSAFFQRRLALDLSGLSRRAAAQVESV